MGLTQPIRAHRPEHITAQLCSALPSTAEVRPAKPSQIHLYLVKLSPVQPSPSYPGPAHSSPALPIADRPHFVFFFSRTLFRFAGKKKNLSRSFLFEIVKIFKKFRVSNIVFPRVSFERGVSYFILPAVVGKKKTLTPGSTEPILAEPSAAKPSPAWPNSADPSPPEPSRAQPIRAQPSRAQPNPTELRPDEPSRVCSSRNQLSPI